MEVLTTSWWWTKCNPHLLQAAFVKIILTEFSFLVGHLHVFFLVQTDLVEILNLLHSIYHPYLNAINYLDNVKF